MVGRSFTCAEGFPVPLNPWPNGLASRRKSTFNLRFVWPPTCVDFGRAQIGSIYVFSKIYQETSGFACWWKMVEKWFGSLGEKTGSLQTELWFVGCPCLNFSGKESLPVSLLTNISLRSFISLLPIPAFTCGSSLFFFTSCDRIFWPRLPITPWGHLNLTRVTCQVFCCFYGNGCFTILANIFVGNLKDFKKAYDPLRT